MRAILVAATLACVLLLSGCAGKDPGVPSGSGSAPADAQEPLAAPAIPEKPSAGTGAPPASAPEPSSSSASASASGSSVTQDAAAAPAPPPTVTDTIDWTGTLGLSQCADTPAGYACALNGPSPTNPLAPNANILHYHHDRAGYDLKGGDLTFTWDATTSPGTENLDIAIYLVKGCPDDCEAGDVLVRQTSASPATFYLTAGHLMEDETIGVQIMPAEYAQGVHLSEGQDVHMTGQLVFFDQAGSGAMAAAGSA